MSFELHPSAEGDLEKASDYYLKKAGAIHLVYVEEVNKHDY